MDHARTDRAHTHLSYGYPHLRGEGRGRGTTRPELGTLKAARSAQQILRSGVTSICVPGGTWFTDVGVRDAIKLGVMEGPRVHCAGRMIITYGSIEDDEPSWVGTPDHGVGVLCNTAAEMVTEVRRQCKHGVNFVKLADSRSGDVQTLAKEEIRRAPRQGLEIFVTYCGFTPMEAIAAGTRDNAFAVGLPDDVGVLAPGRLADIIILKQDPLADVRVLQGGQHLASRFR